MTLTLDMTKTLAERLTTEATRRGVPVPDLVVDIVQRSLDHDTEPNVEAVALIQSWIDDPGIDEQRSTGDFLIKALDEDRASDRPLFPASQEGRTW